MSRANASKSSNQRVQPLPERIRNLLRYYIDCAKEDDGIPLRAALRDLDRRFIPWPHPSDISSLNQEELRITLQPPQRPFATELSRAAGVGSLLYGYPTHIGSSYSTRHAIPLFTWQLEFELNGPELWLGGPREWPQLNPEYLRRLAPSEEGQHEILDSLGLLDTTDDAPPPRFCELLERMNQMGLLPDVVEPIKPEELTDFRQAAGARKLGIYNCAMLFAVERPRFTAGLVRDLREMVESNAPGWADTAFGHILGARSSEAWELEEDQTAVEAVPLNEEQREAVQMAMSAPLTTVTGPPGTGKSQIVVAMIADAYLHDERVLFTSKNNKAVDVVEDRVNSLATNPLMIRTGGRSGERDFRQELVQRLAAMLAMQPTQEDRLRLDDLEDRYGELQCVADDLWAELQQIRVAHEGLSSLRDARARFEKEYPHHQWERLLSSGEPPDRDKLVLALQMADKHTLGPQGIMKWFSRMLSSSNDKRRVQKIATEAVVQCPPLSPLPAETESFQTWRTWLTKALSLWEALDSIDRCRTAMVELHQYRSRDEVARQLRRVRAEATGVGARLVTLYARLVADRLEPEDRRAIGNFRALVEQLSGERLTSRAYIDNRRNIARLFPTVSRHIPAWCVTNLSARNSLPLKPNLFDLLIIDEASQCDIASAIPLLYRSKRAVVIGDTQQLRHITKIDRRRDQQLQLMHGLGADDQIFAYHVNSLFHLSTSLPAFRTFVQLRDHHRSHSNIVGFSNRRWYGDSLRIWTDYRRLKPPPDERYGIRWTNVSGTATRPRGGSVVIMAEVDAVVEQVIELLLKNRFDGTVGIVTPFRAQANAISERIVQSVPPDVLNRAQFIVNTAHGFQGDERDIVLFSPCLSRILTSGARNFLSDTGNLFNVAVTRARSLLHVVGDMDACVSSGIPHVEDFAAYCGDIERAASSPYQTTLPRDERIGPGERPLYEALVAAGLNPVPQFAVNQYRLDLAIVLGELRLAIEVDGVSTHADSLTDIERDERLESLGWRVLRFWNYEVSDDVDYCVQRVLDQIGESPAEAGP